MSNFFATIGKGIAAVAKAFAFGVTHLFGLAKKVEVVLSAAQPLEKPFVDGLVKVVGDVEDLLTTSQVAVTDAGINIPADSAAYQAFLKLYGDARDLLPLAEDALAALEGKAFPVPVAQAIATEQGSASTTASSSAPAAAVIDRGTASATS
jgi:hypothetical protein